MPRHRPIATPRPRLPELLEIEAYRQLFEAHALDRVVRDVEAPDNWYLKEGLSSSGLRDAVVGDRFTAAHRHGKLLLADLERGPTLGLRFGMTGRLIVDDRQALEHLEYGSDRAETTWDRIVVHFDDGGDLRIRDPRRLGGVMIEPDASRLGPDAAALDLAALRDIAGASRAPVKGLLMNQERVAGLGNLLCDDVLFRAGLDPRREARALDADEVRRLHRAIRRSLEVLGRRGGSHTGDLQAERHPGGMCPKCGVELRRERVGGRTTYWCADHQG